MPSSPRSPQTPRHSRHSSTVDSYSGSPQNYNRRQSRSSIHDPTTPNRLSHQDTLDLNVFSSGGADAGGGNGMGNLADELADAFSDSGEEDDGDYTGEPSELDTETTPGGQPAAEGTGDSGVDVNGLAGNEGSSGRGKDGALDVPSPHRTGHQRKSSEYDGSEYGSDTDLDSSGMPPGLVAKIDAVESLARRGTESYGGPEDDVFKKVTEGLRDLGSQSSVEANASR